MQACEPDSREDVELMEQLMPDPSIQTQPEADLAQLIVTTLNLEVAAADIDPQAPLFGEGLGLDSIDVLELALAISQTYGVQLRSDDENNATIFRSLRSLTNDIQQRRQR
jgi:acyl carrier protein